MVNTIILKKLCFKEIIIGRPIKKKWFGLPANAGSQILVSGIKFQDGTTTATGYIVRQVGDTAYIVQDVGQTHAAEICFLANATSVGALNPGFCFINATPFGGSALPCSKIQQYRLETYETNGTRGSYIWSQIPATLTGQADLIVATEIKPTNSVAPAVTGTTTVGSTLTTTTGTWTGSPTYAYQWTINGVNDGTNAATYVIPAGAAGRLIVVNVTATNNGGSTTVSSNTITTT